MPAVPGRAELPAAMVWTGRVAGLSDVTETGTHLRIGGAASLEGAWSALAHHWPGLIPAWERFASPSIRVIGTMEGNLVSGSPVGDSCPVLLVLDAGLVLRRGTQTAGFLWQTLTSGYRATVLEAGEFLTAIVVPGAAMSLDVHSYKVSRRFDSDISTVSGAFALELDGGLITTVRVAFGGMSAMVHRARAMEGAMHGRPWDEAAMPAAQEALGRDFAPIGDHRASADYRLRVARGLLERWWRQSRADRPESLAVSEAWGSR